MLRRAMRWRAGLAIAAAMVAAVASAPAQADRGGHPGNFGFHHPGFGFHHPGFVHPGFVHPGFVHRHVFVRPHFFFRPFPFFGATAFYPVPVPLYPPWPYPAYLTAPVAGAPNCYQYQTTIILGGVPQPAIGTACLQPDGTWRVVP